MPYKKITELPPGLKDNLPKEAQRIWMAVFNESEKRCKSKGGSTETCDVYGRSIGWTAVKNAGFKKDNKTGKWKKTKKSKGEDMPMDEEDMPMTDIDMEDMPMMDLPKEAMDVFTKAYQAALDLCEKDDGDDCEHEAMIMAMVKVRSKFKKEKDGNWIKK